MRVRTRSRYRGKRYTLTSAAHGRSVARGIRVRRRKAYRTRMRKLGRRTRFK